MERIAFLLSSTGEPVYWREIFITAGVIAAVLMIISLRLADKKPLLTLLIYVPLAAALGLYAGRLIHWYCCFESYESFESAMRDLSSGGFSLMGAITGAIAAAVLVWAVRLEKDLPALLDELAGAGALGIAAGRLGELFGTADRGKMILAAESLHRLPWTAAVVNAVSGEEEWRFATFCAQSIWAAALLALILLRRLLRSGKRRENAVSGGDFLVFLALYCLSQVLFDSTRYDALFLRSNGFVSLEQIVSLTVMTLLTAWLSVRAIRRSGFRLVYPICWGLFLAGFGLAGYMEYYVQRYSETYVFSYSLMAAGLTVVYIAFRIICLRARRPAQSDPPEKKEEKEPAEA